MIINNNNYILQLKKHNEKALEYVISEYGGLLKSVISKKLYLYPEDVEECLCDTFMKIWQNIDCYDENKTSFKSWATAIALYRAIDRLRKIRNSAMITGLDDQVFENVLSVSEDEMFNEISLELLECLNEHDRELFVKLYIEGLSVNEISENTGTEKSVIYNRVSRGKKKIEKNHPLLFLRGERNE